MSGADQTTGGRTKHQSKPENPVQDPHNAYVDNIFYGDVDAVFGTRKTRFQTAETRLHKQDKNTAD